ncbi:MAG TPA: DUF6209 family protein [Kofleriaceae bacterium]|jgi:hypothetical protein
MFRFTLLGALAACTTATPPTSQVVNAVDSTGSNEATIAFQAGYTETTTGALVAGSTVRVTYDLSRLETCDAESDGIAVWGTTGYAQFDDGTTVALTVSELQGTAVVPVAADLVLPASATSVAFWFTQTNEWGCVAYDSDFGQNYTFELQASGAAAVVDFPTDPSAPPTQSNPIHAGDQIVVHYDPDRLSRCYALENEQPAWQVMMYWQVDGGAVQSALASRIDGDELVAADPLVTVPPGADLAMWFEATSAYGCDAWDSAYGANYHFAIE